MIVRRLLGRITIYNHRIGKVFKRSVFLCWRLCSCWGKWNLQSQVILHNEDPSLQVSTSSV